MKKDRIAGLDIIKAVASLFVVSIHQIARTGAIDGNLDGAGAFLVMMFRYTVMSCVPLFIMITGYLQCHKKPSAKFYKGIIPVFMTYVVSTAICVIIQAALGDELNIERVIVNTLNYTQNEYAWYVEMFVGLYLLIPFINMMLGETKRQRLLFISVMAVLAMAPSIPRSLSPLDHWMDLLPDYWLNCYPIFYYAIGAYIREYEPKLKKGVNILLLAAAMLFPTVVQFIQAHGGEFMDYVFNGFFSASAFVIALLIFLLLYDTDIKPRPVKAVVTSVASCSLELYLLSFILERLIYSYWLDPKYGTEYPGRLAVMIAAVFVCSYLAAILQKLFTALVKIPLHALSGKIRAKGEEEIKY